MYKTDMKLYCSQSECIYFFGYQFTTDSLIAIVVIHIYIFFMYILQWSEIKN